MPSAPLTEAEVAAILSEATHVAGAICWVQKSDDVWAEATLKVVHARSDIDLKLKVTVNLVARDK